MHMPRRAKIERSPPTTSSIFARAMTVKLMISIWERHRPTGRGYRVTRGNIRVISSFATGDCRAGGNAVELLFRVLEKMTERTKSSRSQSSRPLPHRRSSEPNVIHSTPALILTSGLAARAFRFVKSIPSCTVVIVKAMSMSPIRPSGATHG